jgi:hypothetical protein
MIKKAIADAWYSSSGGIDLGADAVIMRQRNGNDNDLLAFGEKVAAKILSTESSQIIGSKEKRRKSVFK